jgi:hypothetical protein
MEEKAVKQEIQKLVDKFEKIREDGTYKKYNEEQTKKNFILPLFRALGWAVESDDVKAEEKVSKKRVDYAFRINGLNKFFLEAKALKEYTSDSKYIGQAIEYAYNKSVTWAILCNFETLRVFNAEFEFDEKSPLQNVVLDLRYDDYLSAGFEKLLWLSKESFEKRILDTQATLIGKKIRKLPINKQLLADFTEYRSILTKDILKYNRNKNLSHDDLDEIVQRILDRIIFIRTCEDKEIESEKLESLVRMYGDKEGKLYKELNKRYRYYDEGYNSRLFLEHICEDVIISNDVLSRVILGTYKTKEKTIKYDFSAIDADILGIIYEEYLGHILKKTPQRAELKNGKAHRKEQGIYYTPTYIVDYIVRNTVGKKLKKRRIKIDELKILDPASGSGSFLLKAFDILWDYVKRRDKKAHQTKFEDISEGVLLKRKTELLKNTIFGVDLDTQAVEIAQLNLLLKLAEKRRRLPTLQENIKRGNSLIENKEAIGDKAFNWNEKFKEINSKFDVVIGNPPYVSWDSLNRIERKEFESGEYLDLKYACRPNHKDSQPNYYLFFITRAINLLNDEGILSFILPQEWLFHNYAKDFRNYILDNSGEIEIVQFNPNFKVFRGLNETVGTNSLILIIHKKGSKKIIHHYVDEMDENRIKEILNQGIFDKTTAITYSEAYDNIWTFTEKHINKIKEKIQNQKDIVYLDNKEYFAVKGGFQPPVSLARYFEISKEEYKKLNQNEQKIVFNLIHDAKEIKRYSLNIEFKKYWIVANDIESEEIFRTEYPNLYKTLKEKLKTNKKCWWHFPNIRNFELIKNYPVKLLSPRTASKPSFALDTKRSVFKGTNTMIISKKMDIKYILGILNSELSDFWYSNFGYEYHGGKTKKYEPDKTKKYSIPIKIVSEKEQHYLIDLVNKINSLKEKLNKIGTKKVDEKSYIENEIEKIDLQINKFVNTLYGLKEEKKTIEDSLS